MNAVSNVMHAVIDGMYTISNVMHAVIDVMNAISNAECTNSASAS